ncbi:hypothetical protein ZOD2009_14026 [Haladaptatus paucihalophilus DX253]|uniref:Uncharacterized protein n=1 Tax=Haladaptatus paucihalophilus DX253 TaxID=797209 RepID=E7QVG9_HALPU|nr:hypothetical protein [Haladaptatus paucihalophilus]EFW91491.1 hypothetical protein ZOD2009_14026 [Haladaptatus paucihalophilus DX253]SHL31092.1 hypothetical protein SAMN05444342_3482 [Haladaptatus paucihalophilus DX253]
MAESNHHRAARETERGVRYAILAAFVVGLRRRNPGAIVNALVAFAATYLPDAIEREYDITFGPWQRVYSDAAMLTHTVGMLGPYDDVWWWDHLTHTHSATLLGGLVFVTARHNGRDPRPRVLAVVVGLGALWELMEYTIHAVADRFDLEPILVSYGRSDILLDLLFDLVGAVLVLVFGDHFLRNLYPNAE